MQLFSKLLIFAIFAVVPQVSLGAVLYDSSVLGGSIVLQSGTNTIDSYYLATPAGNGSTWAHDFGQSFYTTTATTSKIRLDCISGACISMGGYANAYSVSGAQQWTFSGGTNTGISDGAGGTLWDFVLTIPPSKNLSAFIICTSGNCYSATTTLAKSFAGVSWNGYQNATVIGTPAFQLCDSGGCSGGFSPPSNMTRFINTTPSEATTTATSTTIGASIYINASDYVAGMYLEMSFFNQTYFGASAPSVYETTYGDKFIKIPITASSTVLNLATSTVFTLLGDTNAVYRISRPASWWESVINFFTMSDTGYVTILENKFKFTVSAKTSLDILYDQNITTLNNFANGTSTPVTNCGIATFNFADCAVSLIIPNSQTMKKDITDLRAMVLTHAPIGYVTRFVNIVTSSNTAPMPIITITFTPNSPMRPYPTTFDMGDMFTGGANLLNSVTDPNTGKNAHDIFLPLVQGGVALAVLLTIISDILKIQGHGDRSKKYT